MLRLIFLILIIVFSQRCFAQEIQNALSYRNISGDHYFRLNYENDLFFRTDYYYTQGVHFEFAKPGFRRSFLRHLFLKPKQAETFYGIGLESAGYTPQNIAADSILTGDRPFAGLAYLKTFMISTNVAKRRRVSAILSLGWMGPSAGGYEIQAFIHRHIHNPDPVGWKFQVKNEPVINYELDFEQAVSQKNNHWLLSAFGMARAGTLSTKTAVGLILMAGMFENPFGKDIVRKGLMACAYIHPQVDLVGYDATLQGGPFTKGNPYIISAADISRITFRNVIGLVLQKRRITLDISAKYLTKEFRSGRQHLTGGAALALTF